MSQMHLDHSIVGYFLTLGPEANVQEFERFFDRSLSAQIPDERGSATFTLSKGLKSEGSYLWTVQIGAQFGRVDRQSKPLVLRAVLDVISEMRKLFPVQITQAFWSPALTAEALIGEFNKLPGMMGKFSAAAT
jgi:hypothetical protein